jgi:undecaprenyl-diphosphatase
MSGRWQRDPRAGWLGLALGALGGFVVVALMAMMWPAFDGLDAAASAAIRATRTPVMTIVASWLTSLGGTAFVVTVASALAIWMAVRRNWGGVVYIVMTVGVGWVLGNIVLKNIIQRPRPQGVSIGPLPGDYAMPSAHSLAAFLVFTTLCVIVMLNMPTGRHLKRWLAVGSALAILGVGYSRVYLGVHWVGDVIAAFLLGWAWWSFTTATYFGSVTEEKRVAPRPGVGPDASE